MEKPTNENTIPIRIMLAPRCFLTTAITVIRIASAVITMVEPISIHGIPF